MKKNQTLYLVMVHWPIEAIDGLSHSSHAVYSAHWTREGAEKILPQATIGEVKEWNDIIPIRIRK